MPVLISRIISLIQNVYAPESDPEMVVEKYERSWEQNENLGLNDMKTENYGEEKEEEAKSKDRASEDEDDVLKTRKTCINTQEQVQHVTSVCLRQYTYSTYLLPL